MIGFNNDPENTLIREYLTAAKDLAKREADLQRAMDGLDAAKADERIADITSQRKRTKEADILARVAFDRCETARRAVWRHRAKLAEEHLRELALPLVAEIEQLHRFGFTSVPAPGTELLRHIGCLPRPPFAATTTDQVPTSELQSPALDRSDDAYF